MVKPIRTFTVTPSLPPELELAAIRTIALIRSTRLYGQIIQSQNYADKVASYAYTLAHLPQTLYGLIGGDIGAILSNFRRLRQRG